MKQLSAACAISVCAIVTLLAGCGTQSQIGASSAMPSMPMVAAPVGARRSPTNSAPVVPDAGPNLYVGNTENFGYSNVNVYAPNSNTPLRTITDGTVFLRAIGIRSGELYVVNGDDRSSVTVYEKGGTKLLRTFQKKLLYPRALAFGSNNLFVLNNFQDSHISVTVYNPVGGGAPLRTISAGLNKPVALSYAAGNMYVANQGPFKIDGDSGSVAVYAGGKDRPARVITQGIAKPTALAFDSAGNLYVANVNVTRTRGPAITVYAKGSSKVLRTITDGVGYDIRALAIDGSQNLYVAGWFRSAHVTVYAKGASKPLRTISKGLKGPDAMAFDGSGNLYVADELGHKVAVYDPKTGALLRTIPQGNLSPVALTFGP